MNEFSEAVSPVVKPPPGEMRKPYQEQKEQWGKKKFNTIIVYGQGPVKPVLLLSELTPEQKTAWEQFKTNPLKQTEPDFRVIEGEVYLSDLDQIKNRSDISEADKKILNENKRREWQETGRYALNRWGRLNASAAGLTLYLGLTDELILSGGKTVPKWAKSEGTPIPSERLASWPSEAFLMKDLVVRQYGSMYQKRFGKPIEDAIKIEDNSTNTLENLAYTINNNPDLLTKEKKIGLLASDFHTRRVGMLARLFSVNPSPRGEISAQELLLEYAEISGKKSYQEMLNYMKDSLNNPDLRTRLLGEETWERGLVNENWLSYWIGYLGDVQDVAVLQRVLESLKSPAWVDQTKAEFGRAGINFDDFSNEDLSKLEKENPAKLQQLIAGLKLLKGPLRTGPSIIKDKPAYPHLDK